MRALAFAAVFSATGLLAASATAAPSVRLLFAPGSECADPPALASQLRERSVSVPADPAVATMVVEVAVSQVSGLYDAQMTIREAGHAPTRRAVTASTCEDVFRTFAFTLALAMEEAARPAPVTPPPAAPPPAAPPPAAPPPAAPPPAAPAPVTPPPAPSEPPAPVPSAQLAAPTRLGLGLVVTSGFVTGVAPTLSATFGGGAEIALARGQQILSPLLRLGGFVALPTTATRSDVPTRYGVQSSRLDVCPVRLFEVLRPCLRVEVGRLQLKEFDVPGAELSNELWATTELALSARWGLWSVLFLELDGAVGPALSRPTLHYGGTELYAVPSVVGGGEIALGVHFP